MSTYTWKVESVDSSTGHMIVVYTNGETSTSLNLPLPPAGHDVPAWVDAFAPRSHWTPRLTEVQVGTGGEALIVPPSAHDEDLPNLVGSWQEEYLRALIYTVLEEIREQAV